MKTHITIACWLAVLLIFVACVWLAQQQAEVEEAARGRLR